MAPARFQGRHDERHLPLLRRLVVIALSASLSLTVACAHVDEIRDDAGAARTITIAVWNILHDDRDVAHVATMLRSTNPDVIGLSEVTPSAAAILNEALAEGYPHRLFFDELAVFSRVPLVDVRRVDAGFGKKAQIHFAVAIDGVLVDVSLLHFHAPDVHDPTPAGVYRMLDAAERVHADEMRHALRHRRDERPHVVMGDLNSLPFDDTRAFMARRGYTDVASALSAFPSATWRGDLFGLEARLRIDYVFVSDELTPRALDVTDTHASDHALLVAELALARGAPDGATIGPPRPRRP